MPSLSIIIPCHNGQQYIDRCLKSILKDKAGKYEIIVINDFSQDKTQTVLRKYAKSKTVQIINKGENIGPAKARNLAVKLAKSKYLLFLDADTELVTKNLREIPEKFKKNRSLGAVQVKILKGKTNQTETAGHFLSFAGFPYEIGVNEDERKWRSELDIFAGRSAGLAVRKDVFEKVGGFDEDYFIYGEETDLCWRIRLAGYNIIYFPEITIRHFGKSTLNKKNTFRIFYEGAKNNTANIIKNSKIPVIFYVLPLHIFSWLAISLLEIFKFRFKTSFSVWKGLWWNLCHIAKILKKRALVNKLTKVKLKNKTLFGKTSLFTLIKKGGALAKKCLDR